MRRRTVIVHGPLALRMRRQQAADESALGLTLASLPLLAARLAGGFIRPVTSDDLEPAVRMAIDEGGFAELGVLRGLPGVARAATKTLRAMWDADIGVEEGSTPRLADLALLERRIRLALPPGIILPRSLRDLALLRVQHAPHVVGDIELDRVPDIAPIWRPLLAALCGVVSVRWVSPGTDRLAWFGGEVVRAMPVEAAPTPRVVTCSNPRSEVIEALRWARQLITSGKTKPEEVAITAASTDEWDDHVLTLSRSAELPVHMSNGVPALSTEDGQACAALADILLNGLSQQRVRRLFVHSVGKSERLRSLPRDWAVGISRDAGLFEPAHWKTALERARQHRTDDVDVVGTIMPAVDNLAKGVSIAAVAGTEFLRPAARELWSRALRSAPVEALALSLHDLRVTHAEEAACSIVWCPAHHLVGAPRRWVWMMGMTSGSWPRKRREDPLLPDHLFPRDRLDWDPVTERQRHNFRVICTHAIGGSYVSHSRRNAAGGQLPASPLLLPFGKPLDLRLSRIPRHAFSEADRLLARPQDAQATPRVRSALAGFADWQASEITAHDGRVDRKHPVIDRALAQAQSATSLRRLLRDPISFVWRYALGWRATTLQSQPLELDARLYGELVHELLHQAVDFLELGHGYMRASQPEVRTALAHAVSAVAETWPLERAVPPRLLWQHTLRVAERLAFKALTTDATFAPGARCWTEVPFGSCKHAAGKVPWDPTAEVFIPGTAVTIRGSIDRLDLDTAGTTVSVTDYKTGAQPQRAGEIIIGGGAELQRVVYAIAARQLLPDARAVVARLFYLAEDVPIARELKDVQRVVGDLSGYVAAACELLDSGKTLPGLQRDEHDEYRFAMPATIETYLKTKDRALRREFGRYVRIWSAR